MFHKLTSNGRDSLVFALLHFLSAAFVGFFWYLTGSTGCAFVTGLNASAALVRLLESFEK